MIYYEIILIVTAVDLIQCDLNDPNFEECLKNSIESALPDLAKGKK